MNTHLVWLVDKLYFSMKRIEEGHTNLLSAGKILYCLLQFLGDSLKVSVMLISNEETKAVD